jgi:lysine 2,3-aminomutase
MKIPIESLPLPSDASTGAIPATMPNLSELAKKGAERFGVTPERFCDWRWQMSHQLCTLSDLRQFLALSPQEESAFSKIEELFRVGITPYYLMLMDDHFRMAADGMPECPIRRQAIPLHQEALDPIGIPDPLLEVGHSPVREVVHLYPDRVAFCVAQICPVYCRYCYRKRRDDEVGLHFNRRILDSGLAYIAGNPAIRDVLITGGDPFLASDQQLFELTARIREIPHVEIIRFGTRTPVTLPYRITEELCRGLAQFHPIWINTHFNCSEELSPDALQSTTRLVQNGFPVGNQSVMLKGVNDSGPRMLELCRGLIKARIRPYYVFHAHLIEGTQHLRVSLDKGLAVMSHLRGRVSGFGIPQFIVDTPSGKIPLSSSGFVLSRDGEDAILHNHHGEIYRERHAFFDD